MEDKSRLWNLLFFMVTQLLLVGPPIYIVILVMGMKYSLFSWHPILGAIGVGPLMAEAIFCVTGEAILTSRLSRLGKIRLHYILQIFGLASLVASYLAAVMDRNDEARPPTIHRNISKISLVVCILIAITGSCVLCNGGSCCRVKPIIPKLIHNCGGIIATIVLAAASISGIYSTSWGSVSDLDQIFLSVAYIISTLLVLAKPFCNVSRSLSYCRA